MSFMLRRFQGPADRYTADARRAAAESTEETVEGPDTADADRIGVRRGLQPLSAADMRAMAGRAAASGAFQDGLPIRVSLD